MCLLHVNIQPEKFSTASLASWRRICISPSRASPSRCASIPAHRSCPLLFFSLSNAPTPFEKKMATRRTASEAGLPPADDEQRPSQRRRLAPAEEQEEQQQPQQPQQPAAPEQQQQGVWVPPARLVDASQEQGRFRCRVVSGTGARCQKDPFTTVCPICRERAKDELGTTVLPCGHTFCTGCIGNWIDSSGSVTPEVRCPTCRALITPAVVALSHQQRGVSRSSSPIPGLLS